MKARQAELDILYTQYLLWSELDEYVTVMRSKIIKPDESLTSLQKTIVHLPKQDGKP